MPGPGLLAVVACSVCLLSPTAAQATWIVDHRSGPGVHFTDLPPALLAAADGDTILVRGPGGPPPFNAYTAGTTSKALTLLGVGRPKVWAGFFTPTPLHIVGIPTGRSFVMKGFDFLPFLGSPSLIALSIANCQGFVHLEDIGTGNQVACSLLVTGCTNVTINRCVFGRLPSMPPGFMGTSAATLTNSVVAMTETSMGGDPAGGTYYHGFCLGQTPASPALSTANSTVLWSGGVLLGGDGFDCGIFGIPIPVPGSMAVQQQGGLLVLTGTTSTSCRAGILSGTSAIHSFGGSLILSPDVRVIPDGNQPGIGGSSRVAVQALPFLSGAGAAAGLPVQLDLFASLGDAGILLASYPAPPMAVPPLGYLWLSPHLFTVGTVVFTSGRNNRFSLPVPAGTPDGLVFSFQGAAGTAAGVALSNPAALVLH